MPAATPDLATGSASSLRLITADEFVQKARISKSTLSRLEKNDPGFPKPGQLASRGNRLWLESAVDDYLRAKLSATASPNAGRVQRAVARSVQVRAATKRRKNDKLAARQVAQA